MRPRVHPLAVEIEERELSVEEFDARLARSLGDEAEMEGLRELIAWFTKRYPTIDERLAYVRRKVRDIARSSDPL